MSAAAKRTVLAAGSLLALIALAILVPAGGAASSARDEQPPSTPRNLRVVSATASLVAVAWDPSSDDDAVAGYYVFGDRGKGTVDTPAYVVSGLRCGQSTLLTVSAFDRAGNRSERATLTVASAPCLDTQPPSAPSGFAQVATSQDSVVLAWSPAADNVGVVAYGVYRDLQRVASPADPSVALSGLACGATAPYAVDAVDAAGNRSPRVSVYVRTAACAPAPPPPPPPSPAPSEWTFCAAEHARCAFTGSREVRYGAEATFTAPRTFVDGVECTNAVFGDPLVGTPKRCETRAADAPAPAPPTPAPAPAPPDTTPPSVPGSLGVAGATATSISLAWSPSTDDVAVSAYRTYVNDAYAATTTQPPTTLAGLSCGNAYTLAVDAVDAQRNASAKAAVIGSTRPCADARPPSAPSGLVATSRTASSIALAWNASTDDVGVVGYGLYRDGAQVGTSASASTIFAGLACNANHTLAIDAYDAAGNRSPKATLMVSTTACPDTTPPTAPSALAAANVTPTSLALSWNASSDDVAVAGYDVYRDGVRVASPSASPSPQAGLTCATSYAFAVEARDAAGNRSPRATLNVSTGACASAPSWSFCANENQRCAFTGAKEVRYGANGTFTAPLTFEDGVECTNAVFGDPVVGVPKHCEARASGSTTPSPPASTNYLLAESFDNFDSSRWQKEWWWNGDTYYHYPSGEAQAYRDANTTVQNGVLALSAKQETVTDFQGRQRAYTSGIVQSNGVQGSVPRGFEFTYGKIEARIKVAKGQGFWNQFWLCNSSFTASCSREIDILEVVGKDPQGAHFNVHWNDLGANSGLRWAAPADLGDDFHVYALEWRPSFIAWSVDGVERYRYTGPDIPADPHYVLLNLAVGEPGTWPGTPDATTPFPSSMLVDYVRVTA